MHKTLAKQLAKALEPHKPLFIEEPLLPGQVPELNRLAGQTTIPIAVSAHLSTPLSLLLKSADVFLYHSWENGSLLVKIAALTLKVAASTSFNLIVSDFIIKSYERWLNFVITLHSCTRRRHQRNEAHCQHGRDL